MKNPINIILVIGLLLVAILYIYPMFGGTTPQTSQEPTKQTDQTPPAQNSTPIVVEYPQQGMTVTGPELTLTGKAVGGWYFEASFPIILKDQLGNEVAYGIAEAQSDWMVADYVPFVGIIDIPTTAKGPHVITFQKDNPSGEPQNDAHVDVTIVIQ